MQKRWCWVKWHLATGRQEVALLHGAGEAPSHGAGEAAHQKQQTGGATSAYRQVTLAAQKSQEKMRRCDKSTETAWRSKREA